MSFFNFVQSVIEWSSENVCRNKFFTSFIKGYKEDDIERNLSSIFVFSITASLQYHFHLSLTVRPIVSSTVLKLRDINTKMKLDQIWVSIKIEKWFSVRANELAFSFGNYLMENKKEKVHHQRSCSSFSTPSSLWAKSEK